MEELLLRKKFVILQEYATVDKWDSKTAIGGRKRKTRRKRKRRRKTRRKGKKRRKKRKTRKKEINIYYIKILLYNIMNRIGYARRKR